jgi:hypothetical protein
VAFVAVIAIVLVATAPSPGQAPGATGSLGSSRPSTAIATPTGRPASADLPTAGPLGYTCATEWTPDPTASPAPGASQAPGYVQPDLGKSHAASGPQRYALCPPASGTHYSGPGLGPIPAVVYGPEDWAVPMGWIHNLEHAGLVLLYRCREGDTACSEDGLAALDAAYAGFPDSPICHLPRGLGPGPVVARFDEMAWPYAAIVWQRVLPLESLDTARIHEFYRQFGDRTAPEPQCAIPAEGIDTFAGDANRITAPQAPEAGARE